MDALETQAALATLLADPDVLRAHAPQIARRVAAAIMQVPGAVVLGDTDGMCVFYPEGDGHYDMHYLFPPWTRGKAALDRIRAMLAFMFVHLGAAEVCGETPTHNRAARTMNRALGGVPTGEAVNTEAGRCIRYVLTREAFLANLREVTT